MFDPSHPIVALLRRDKRYRFDAYVFVFESLRFAQEVLGFGTEQPSELIEEDADAPSHEPAAAGKGGIGGETKGPRERHLTGQELCEAIRRYALQQYGYMAKNVLNHWGVKQTSDFGEIVFNLIEIGQMRKTDRDRREDFDDVFDFDAGLRQQFEFTLPD